MRKKFELREGETFGSYKLAYKPEAYSDDGELLMGDAPWCKFNINEINNSESMKQFELSQFGALIQ